MMQVLAHRQDDVRKETMDRLRIEVKQSDVVPEITVIEFDGDLDNASINGIANCFDQVLKRKATFVVAEMSRAKGISSAALGELMGGRKVLVDQQGELVISGLSLDLKTKMTLLGANKIFKFYTDLRSAINAYEWEFQGRSEQLCLSFPPELQYVPPVRQMVSRLTKQKGYGRRDAFRIETIVDEICNNAVEHGLAMKGENIDLTIRINQQKIEIKVVGKSDPTKLDHLKEMLKPDEKKTPVSPDDRRGRGLSLIKLLSTELNIDFSEQGTSVHVTKVKEE
jgi:anti-anti-sigma factor